MPKSLPIRLFRPVIFPVSEHESQIINGLAVILFALARTRAG
jgi:hypothetical protein